MANKIERQTVTCEGQDVDRYGRTVAICLAGGVDLGQWMVAQGQALAYIEYSARYVPDEEKARAARLGLWAGEFQPPWDFRRGKADKRTPPPRKNQAPPKVEQKAPSAGEENSDQDIIKILRERSLRAYSGSCPCPESTDRDGHRCGNRSAYSRPGGATPLCYDSNVTPAMIAEYRKTKSVH